MQYRNTIRSQFTGYISSDNNDNSFSSSVQPQVQLENNIISTTFSGYKVTMKSNVMTDSNNNVLGTVSCMDGLIVLGVSL